ncbi:MAG: hypothetical protein NT007_18780 [Candidatus Kapabacteria bacterium]|nr:hypothetical protein [Candidatus Kapabacteria bacterium]
MENAKCRMQNAKCRMQNAELKKWGMRLSPKYNICSKLSLMRMQESPSSAILGDSCIRINDRNEVLRQPLERIWISLGHGKPCPYSFL